MKIFISWSGSRSKAVAEMLSDWLRSVLQATRPWISTRNIDRGALWFTEIHDQLKDTAVGIVCLTQENKNRPWILFETGALAKGLSTTRVCTLLIDLKPVDLEDPLAQFNHTLPERDGMWELVRTLNSCLGVNGLDDRILPQVFNTYWPQFESKFAETVQRHTEEATSKPRDQNDILSEILENTRSLNNRVRRLELNSRASDRDAMYVAAKNVRPGEKWFDVQRAAMLNQVKHYIGSRSDLGPSREQLVKNIAADFGMSEDMADNLLREVLP